MLFDRATRVPLPNGRGGHILAVSQAMYRTAKVRPGMEARFQRAEII
jgi:hypothetical protein